MLYNLYSQLTRLHLSLGIIFLSICVNTIYIYTSLSSRVCRIIKVKIKKIKKSLCYDRFIKKKKKIRNCENIKKINYLHSNLKNNK